MTLDNNEFSTLQKIIFTEIGINLNKSKMSLITNRLYSRLVFYNIDSYSQYINILENNHKEINELINLITTNETYFFREEQHFDFLKELARDGKNKKHLRVWSAAARVGAEAYSIAMTLASILAFNQWSVVASDINTDVITKAKTGLYCESWLKKIPQEFREKYCLKGKSKYEGKFIIDRELVNNVRFIILNLKEPILDLEKFDVIFLRNVLIYFDKEIKQLVLNNVLKNLKVGAYLIISLTENLDEIKNKNLTKIASSIYKKIG